MYGKSSFFMILVVFICLTVFGFLFVPVRGEAAGGTREEVYQAAQKTIDYYYQNYQESQFRGLLDWPALGLFGFGEDVGSSKWTVDGKNGAYWREEEVRQGINLSKTKNTDYQRTIIGVCAAGKDPRNFGGLNLVEIEKSTMLASGHFADSVADKKTGRPVGEDLVNAHIFGIISLHCAGEPIPNRDLCLAWLEKQQHKDGGFTWDVKHFEDPADYDLVESDVDMTAAALMAFAILGKDSSYPAAAKALDFLKNQQLDSGGFHSWGVENPESCAWVVQALTLMGQDPAGPEWTKPSGGNPVTAILSFQLPDGSFTHVREEDSDLPIFDNDMSTYIAFYALADVYQGKSTYELLYEKYRPEAEKNLFSDYRPGQSGFSEAMELVYDHVLSGYPDGTFKPDQAVTRAEFAKYLVSGLGLEGKAGGSGQFKDVAAGHWAEGCIGLCAEKGYVTGTASGLYSPEAGITGDQLMAMLVRAAGQEEKARSLMEEGKEWSWGYLKAAEQAGLVYPGFASDKAATRSQCAWAVVRLRELIS